MNIHISQLNQVTGDHKERVNAFFDFCEPFILSLLAEK